MSTKTNDDADDVLPRRCETSGLQTLRLRDDRIVETVSKLQIRVSERFPESGLSNLCAHLNHVALSAAERSVWIGQPILWIRVVGYSLAIGLIAVLIAIAAHAAQLRTDGITFIDFIQTFESGVNEIAFVCIAIYFLTSLETRIKRRRALAAVHELRSIAHIIDMHQLTKDPERIQVDWQATESSPRATMTPFLLSRYLDYCSEMLSLIGKIAALYVERFDDGVSVAAVSEVEQLSTSLSRKIWQKIMILNQSRPSRFE